MVDREERRAPFSPEKEEEEERLSSFETLAREHGLHKYEASPLFRTSQAGEPGRVFARPAEIAKEKGYKTEAKSEVNMNNEKLKEEFLNELFGGLGGYDWITLNLGQPSSPKQKSLYSPAPKGPIRGITDFSSTLAGLFGGSVKAASEKKKYATPEDSQASESGKTFVPKKEIDRASNAAQRIQQAGGFTSDRSLKDLDIPTFLRNAMERDIKGTASPEQKETLQQTGYRAKLSGSSYGQVGASAPSKVSPETASAVSKRTDVYSNKPYRAIRGESIEQTEARILAEVRQSVVGRNKKGGEVINNPVEDVPASIPGFPAITNESVISFVNDLCEGVPDGAAGVYSSVNKDMYNQLATSPKAGANVGDQKAGFTSPPPAESPEGREVMTDTSRPTLLRKAALGDKKAEASVQGIKGELSGPELDPNRKSYVGAEHTLSRSQFLAKPYMQIQGTPSGKS